MRACEFTNKGLQHRCFPVNFAIFLRTLCLRNTSGGSSENDESQQLTEGFANSCYKISPILLQELINGFAVCKHCIGTLLLFEYVTSSHGCGNQNYIFQKGATLFNRSTQNILYFLITLHKVYIF